MKELYTRNRFYKGFTQDYFVTKDGAKLRYVHKGDGFPTIFVPCFDSPLECYSFNAPTFADIFSVYVIDMRGHGLSDATKYGANVPRLATDLHEFIEFIGAPKVNLVAWSMGCCVLWAYIELFGQEKINKLVLQDEPAQLIIDPFESEADNRKYGGAVVCAEHVRHAMRRSMEEGWASLSSQLSVDSPASPITENNLPPDNYSEMMAEINYPEIDEEHRYFLADLIRNHMIGRWQSLVSTIRVPTLLLSGEASGATTAESMEWLSKAIQNCEHVRFSREEFGTHDLNQTAYKKYNRVVREFLMR